MPECSSSCTKYDGFLTSTPATGDTKWLEEVNAINFQCVWEYPGNCLPFKEKTNLHRCIYFSNIVKKLRISSGGDGRAYVYIFLSLQSLVEIA